MTKKKTLEKLKIIALLFLAALLSHISGIGCPIRWLTGIPCAGCGMSRALLSVFKGHFGAAWSYHPLILLMLPLAILWLTGRLQDRRIIKLQKPATTLIITAFIAVYIVRLVLKDSVLEVDISKGILWKLAREVHNVLSVLR